MNYQDFVEWYVQAINMSQLQFIHYVMAPITQALVAFTGSIGLFVAIDEFCKQWQTKKNK